MGHVGTLWGSGNLFEIKLQPAEVPKYSLKFNFQDPNPKICIFHSVSEWVIKGTHRAGAFRLAKNNKYLNRKIKDTENLNQSNYWSADA